ncbi:MAG TPA: SprT-like domain-containing protein [Chitinophagaceae bacterium]|jgi:Ca2+-binding EF-hand superfamily protein|nr:SprT-like domain-containing protein [Chitinophagaceae bacterium]
MPKKEAPLSALQDFIPVQSAPIVFEYLKKYKVHLTITRNRKTVLGDYRHASGESTHRISVNGNLNKYSFLITLIHELAHLLTFIQFSNRVLAHGKEWKNIYRKMLVEFMSPEIFPQDIMTALERSLHNLPASSCADVELARALKKYDVNHEGLITVEQLQEGTLFDIGGGKIFKKGKQLRKRFQCQELKSGKIFLFSPLYEVKSI